MNSWAPLFAKIVDSSIWTEPDYVRVVFITMLAIKDSDHVVRCNAFGLGRKCWPNEAGGEKKVLDAIKILSSPDTKRLEPQPHQGRRIQKTDDGWLILNGQFYEDMMREVNRKVYKARKQREYREKQRKAKGSGPLPGEATYLRSGEMPHEFRETPPDYTTGNGL